jgi:hypothetical protein
VENTVSLYFHRCVEAAEVDWGCPLSEVTKEDLDDRNFDYLDCVDGECVDAFPDLD